MFSISIRYFSHVSFPSLFHMSCPCFTPRSRTKTLCLIMKMMSPPIVFAAFTPDCCHRLIPGRLPLHRKLHELQQEEQQWGVWDRNGTKNSVCVCEEKWFWKNKRVVGGGGGGGGGGRSRDWAVWLNHAARSDLFSFSFHPPLFMSAPSTRACTQEKGHTHTQNTAFKGDQWEFFVWKNIPPCVIVCAFIA